MPDVDPRGLFAPSESEQTVVEAARAYLAVRAAAARAESALKAARDQLMAAESDLLQKFEEAGVLSVKVETDGKPVTVSSATSDYYSLPAGALEDADVHRWLLRMGGHDLVRRTIHHMSFSSFCRELAAAGKNIHPTVRKATKKVVRILG